ncbi:MAG: hypothetical protein LBC20_15230 [Planctomycetaceae bacterium]|nr:hypothetical protein [Planctomycetaceae bacterium]
MQWNIFEFVYSWKLQGRQLTGEAFPFRDGLLFTRKKEAIKAGYFVKWRASLFFNMKPLEVLEK